MILPRRLRPGHKIGIVSPSSPVIPEELEKGIARFQERGYQVEVGHHVLSQSNTAGLAYLAGDDAARADDINGFFARDDIDAIVCARGGCGAIRLVDRLDWDLIRAHPKVFVGYSDITTIHLGLAQPGGFVSFHGSDGGGPCET